MFSTDGSCVSSVKILPWQAVTIFQLTICFWWKLISLVPSSWWPPSPLSSPHHHHHHHQYQSPNEWIHLNWIFPQIEKWCFPCRKIEVFFNQHHLLQSCSHRCKSPTAAPEAKIPGMPPNPQGQAPGDDNVWHTFQKNIIRFNRIFPPTKIRSEWNRMKSLTSFFLRSGFLARFTFIADEWKWLKKTWNVLLEGFSRFLFGGSLVESLDSTSFQGRWPKILRKIMWTDHRSTLEMMNHRSAESVFD